MARGCYEPNYLTASFKGVSFYALDADSEHGRRGAEGEFPFAENTAYADLGRKIRRYRIRGQFRENSHLRDVEALIAACESPNPGTLVHPTRGIMQVACVSLVVRDDIETSQGVTDVDLTFVEANQWPNNLRLTVQVFSSILSTIIGISEANFLTYYVPSQIQYFRRDAVVDAVQAQVANIATAYSNATFNTANSKRRTEVLNDLLRLANDDILAVVPENAARALTLGAAAAARASSGEAQYNAFRTVANGASKTSSFGGRAANAENALYSHVRILAAAYMAEAAVEATFRRQGVTFGRIDAISTILDGEMEYAQAIGNNELYLQLQVFRNDIVSQLYAKAYSNPGVVQYDFGGAVHPYVAAYAIYNDASRLRDIEALNILSANGRLPRFVVGGTG